MKKLFSFICLLLLFTSATFALEHEPEIKSSFETEFSFETELSFEIEMFVSFEVQHQGNTHDVFKEKTSYLNCNISFIPYTVQNTPFCVGFKDGYQEGYCHDTYSCIPPIPPICPIPTIQESRNSERDGYNRGFKLGLRHKK